MTPFLASLDKRKGRGFYSALIYMNNEIQMANSNVVFTLTKNCLFARKYIKTKKSQSSSTDNDTATLPSSANCNPCFSLAYETGNNYLHPPFGFV